MAVKKINQYDTNLLFVVYSSRLGGKFECHRFREYSIDLDLDTDADAWDFVFKNPNNVYTSLFSKFDMVDIYIDGKGIMSGRVDNVVYHSDDTDNYVRVSGRDLVAALVDNHAIPTTLQNIRPHEYIASKCSEYGIPYTNLDKTMKIVQKNIIGVGESEMSIISKFVNNENKKIWLDYKTLYTGKWNMDARPEYTFTRGVPIEKACIPILSFELSDSALEVYSESIVYGSTSSGENKVIGSSKNSYMVKNGIKRRMTTNSSNDDGANKYTANAEDDVRYGFDNSVSLEISIRTKGILVKPNTTAWVIDMSTRTNAIFFIKKVNYSKSLDSGSITRISMIPSKKANDQMYAAQGTLGGGITGKASMTFNDLWNAKKG